MPLCARQSPHRSCRHQPAPVLARPAQGRSLAVLPQPESALACDVPQPQSRYLSGQRRAHQQRRSPGRFVESSAAGPERPGTWCAANTRRSGRCRQQQRQRQPHSADAECADRTMRRRQAERGRGDMAAHRLSRTRTASSSARRSGVMRPVWWDGSMCADTWVSTFPHISLSTIICHS
jgi:hypothetical protein